MNKIDLNKITLTKIPTIVDEFGRGNLSIIENEVLPFKIERVFYIYGVPNDARRGGHAHYNLQQFLLALNGSMDVILDNGFERKKITLNNPNSGLLIPNGIWADLENFSESAVCIALVSAIYVESDYIRDYEKFKLFKGAQ